MVLSGWRNAYLKRLLLRIYSASGLSVHNEARPAGIHGPRVTVESSRKNWGGHCGEESDHDEKPMGGNHVRFPFAFLFSFLFSKSIIFVVISAKNGGTSPSIKMREGRQE